MAFASMIKPVITRSEATQLVTLYHNCGRSFDGFKSKCREEKIPANSVINNNDKILYRLYGAIIGLMQYVNIKDMPNMTDYSDVVDELPPGEKTMQMLHHAVDNYIYNHRQIYNCENLCDRFKEETTCAVCCVLKYSSFTFSTVYGLDVPVCRECMSESEADDENDIRLYKKGWQAGWRAAMKYMNDCSAVDIPPPSACVNCGDVTNKLKRCGGTCNGSVKYCSSQCQREHWKSVHKHKCQRA